MNPTVFMTIIVLGIMLVSAIKVIEFIGQSLYNHFHEKKTKSTKHKGNMPVRMRKRAKRS